MKSVVASILIASALLLSGCVHPQIIRSYEELRTALKPGDRVEVSAAAGRISGTVESASADSLTIMSDDLRREIPRGTIGHLEKLERLWHRGAVMGLAIGGGTGAAIAGFSDCRAGETSCGGTRARGVAGSALVGVGIGAAVGAKLRTTLIYVGQGGGAVR